MGIKMENILLVALYLLEVVKYYLVYAICYNEVVKKYWIPCIGMVCYTGFLMMTGISNPEDNYMIACGVIMLVLLTATSGQYIERLVHMLVSLFFVCCIDEFVGMFYKLINTVIKNEIQVWYGEYFWQSIGTVVILLGISYFKPHLKVGNKVINFMRKNIQNIIILVAIEMLLTIAGLSYLGGMIENLRGQRVVIVLCAAAYVCLGMLVVFVIYVWKTNETMEHMVKNAIFLKNMQKHYYETLLEKEQDTRNYRHDIKNHLICLEALAKEGKIESVCNYVKEMKSEIVQIQKKTYRTGNQIIDAITSYYGSFLLKETEIRVEGMLNVSIDEIQLCTIYGNILENAVEELQRIPEGMSHILNIQLAQGKAYAKICVRNSLSQEQKNRVKEDFLRTKKKDKQNHGIGLRNVRRTLEEIGGKLELEKTEEEFITTVIIPVSDYQ